MNTNNKIIAGFTALSIAFMGGTAILQEKIKIPPVSMTANAVGNLYYTESNGTIKITNCNELAEEVVIPAEIDGIPVTAIEKEAFKFCKKLTSVRIPNSITSIGNYAFYVCSSLTSLTIPDSVIYINDHAFESCSKLKSVKLSENIKSINRFAFSSCESLTSIIIPENVTYIENHAFYDCTALEEITILNPKCSIYDSMSTISETATIFGYENSRAQEYAEKYNYKFQSLGEIPQKFITTTSTSTKTTTTSTSTTSTSTTSTSTTSTTTITTTTITKTSTSRKLTQTETGTRGTEGYWATGTQTNIHSTHSNSNNHTNTATTTTTANNDKLLGDINGDGLIDSVDATLIMSYYAYVSAYEGNGEPDTFPEYLDKYLNK